jgi:hypothetical protein
LLFLRNIWFWDFFHDYMPIHVQTPIYVRLRRVSRVCVRGGGGWGTNTLPQDKISWTRLHVSQWRLQNGCKYSHHQSDHWPTTQTWQRKIFVMLYNKARSDNYHDYLTLDWHVPPPHFRTKHRTSLINRAVIRKRKRWLYTQLLTTQNFLVHLEHHPTSLALFSKWTLVGEAYKLFGLSELRSGKIECHLRGPRVQIPVGPIPHVIRGRHSWTP